MSVAFGAISSSLTPPGMGRALRYKERKGIKLEERGVGTPFLHLSREHTATQGRRQGSAEFV